MSNLDKDDMIDDLDTDTESMDPFQNRRLSEVVAQMLDNESDSESTQSELDAYTEECEIHTAFIDYNEEPKNKELFRGPLPSIEESDLEDAFACEDEGYQHEMGKAEFMGLSYCKTELQDQSMSDSYSENKIIDYSQHIKTVIGRSTETIFGAFLPQECEEIENRVKCRSETEFGVNTDFNGLRYRWSVTSV